LHDAIFTDLQHSSARKMPAHSHELAFFALLLESDYREQYGRQHTYFGPFTMSFRPAGIPHQDEVGPRGVKFFEIEVRPSWQRRLKECSGTLDLPLNDCEGGELLWLGMKLFRETRGSAVTQDLCVESLLAELLGTVARMPRETIRDAPKWLNHTLDKLRAECCERLTLDELGKDAGVHPVHLSRVFRRCIGEGIGEYVHRLRMRAACEHMLSPEMPLAEIALATGFADQSHFTRTFRKVTGMSPGAFRAVMSRT
jgi:AraC family transcriptional regulator